MLAEFLMNHVEDRKHRSAAARRYATLRIVCLVHNRRIQSGEHRARKRGIDDPKEASGIRPRLRVDSHDPKGRGSVLKIVVDIKRRNYDRILPGNARYSIR